MKKVQINFGIENLELEVDTRSKSGEFIRPYDKDLDMLSTVDNILAEKRCISKMRLLQNKG